MVMVVVLVMIMMMMTDDGYSKKGYQNDFYYRHHHSDRYLTAAKYDLLLYVCKSLFFRFQPPTFPTSGILGEYSL